MKNIFKILVLVLLSLPSFGQQITQGKPSGRTKLNPASALKKGTDANQFLITVASDSSVRYANRDTVLEILGIGESCVDILYDDLYTLYDNANLVKGKKYRITDYKTIFNLNISGTAYTDANIEPIVVTALGTSQLEPIAFSATYPKDIIYYSIDGGSYMPGSTKGCITRRIDTEKNISVPFDFREFKVEAALLDNSPAYDEFVTFGRGQFVLNGSSSYVSLKPSNIGNDLGDPAWWKQITDGELLEYYGETLILFGPQTYSTTVSRLVSPFQLNDTKDFHIKNTFGSLPIFYISGYVQNVTIDNIHLCHITRNIINCKFGLLKRVFTFGSGKILDTQIGQLEDSFIPGELTRTKINSYPEIGTQECSNNILLGCRENNIGGYFSGNIIGENFQNNTIGLRFQNNTIGNNFGNDTDEAENYGNQIGNDFQNNVVGDGAFGNIIGNNCNANIWDNWFFDNHLGNNFKSNTIGTNFQHNNLPYNFYSNTIGSNFMNWNGQCNLNGVDFTALTLPASGVSKYILYDATDLYSWGYWDNGVFTVTPF